MYIIKQLNIFHTIHQIV